MQPMMTWVAPHGALLQGEGDHPTIHAAAAAAVQRALNFEHDLELDLVLVEDRVKERRHDTGIKSFDDLLRRHQGTFIAGDVLGDAQLSVFVHGRENTACNGQQRPKGHLQRFDIDNYLSDPRLAGIEIVKNWFRNDPRADQDVYVHCLRNGRKAGERGQDHVYGYLFTDRRHELLCRMECAVNGARVLDEAEHFLTTKHHVHVEKLASVRDGVADIPSAATRALFEALPALPDELVEYAHSLRGNDAPAEHAERPRGG